jgi:hypothetical protein
MIKYAEITSNYPKNGQILLLQLAAKNAIDQSDRASLFLGPFFVYCISKKSPSKSLKMTKEANRLQALSSAHNNERKISLPSKKWFIHFYYCTYPFALCICI